MLSTRSVTAAGSLRSYREADALAEAVLAYFDELAKQNLVLYRIEQAAAKRAMLKQVRCEASYVWVGSARAPHRAPQTRPAKVLGLRAFVRMLGACVRACCAGLPPCVQRRAPVCSAPSSRRRRALRQRFGAGTGPGRPVHQRALRVRLSSALRFSAPRLLTFRVRPRSWIGKTRVDDDGILIQNKRKPEKSTATSRDRRPSSATPAKPSAESAGNPGRPSQPQAQAAAAPASGPSAKGPAVSAAVPPPSAAAKATVPVARAPAPQQPTLPETLGGLAPLGSSQPAQPVQPVQPVQSVQSMQPVQPVQPVQPAAAAAASPRQAPQPAPQPVGLHSSGPATGNRQVTPLPPPGPLAPPPVTLSAPPVAHVQPLPPPFAYATYGFFAPAPWPHLPTSPHHAMLAPQLPAGVWLPPGPPAPTWPTNAAPQWDSPAAPAPYAPPRPPAASPNHPQPAAWHASPPPRPAAVSVDAPPSAVLTTGERAASSQLAAMSPHPVVASPRSMGTSPRPVVGVGARTPMFTLPAGLSPRPSPPPSVRSTSAEGTPPPQLPPSVLIAEPPPPPQTFDHSDAYWSTAVPSSPRPAVPVATAPPEAAADRRAAIARDLPARGGPRGSRSRSRSRGSPRSPPRGSSLRDQREPPLGAGADSTGRSARHHGRDTIDRRPDERPSNRRQSRDRKKIHTRPNDHKSGRSRSKSRGRSGSRGSSRRSGSQPGRPVRKRSGSRGRASADHRRRRSRSGNRRSTSRDRRRSASRGRRRSRSRSRSRGRRVSPSRSRGRDRPVGYLHGRASPPPPHRPLARTPSPHRPLARTPPPLRRAFIHVVRPPHAGSARTATDPRGVDADCPARAEQGVGEAGLCGSREAHVLVRSRCAVPQSL